MRLDDTVIGKALSDLFPPNKKTAPKVEDVDELGCPTAEDEDREDTEGEV